MIYLNGELVEEGAARIDPSDRGLLLGDGLFETVRVMGGMPFRLGAHLARLASSAKTLSIAFPVPLGDIAPAVNHVLAANRLDRVDAAVRITLTRGPGPRGLAFPQTPKPSLLISATAFTQAGNHGRTASIVGPRRNEHSPLSQLKTINYLDNVLAAEEARQRGSDEALMLNAGGRLACGSRANLFMVLEKVLYTPPPTEGVLPGMARGLVLELARAMNVRVRQSAIFVRDLPTVVEAFLTNSLEQIMPIIQVDGRPVGSGEVGPLTRRLMAGYGELGLAKRV